MSALLPFAVIRDHNSVNQLILSFQPFLDKIQIFLIEKDGSNNFTIKNNSSQWFSILLHKQEQFEYAILEDQKISLFTNKNFVQSSYFGFMCTWQNLTFSLKAFNQKSNRISEFLILKNLHLVNIFRQIILNRRDQIYIQFYFRQPYLNVNKSFLLLLDDLQMLKFLIQNSTINIIDEVNYFKNEVQGVGTQWNFVSIQLIEWNTILTVITDKENILKNNIQKKYKDPNLIFGLQLIFFNNQIQIDNVLIVNNYEVIPTFECYPNCLECNLNQCLKCHNNLSIQNYCLCTDVQYYDYEGQVCLDISQQQSIEKVQFDDKKQNCVFGYYFNKDLSECMHCPQIQQFECQECLFNTETWNQNRTCIFQEIYTLKFMELYYQYQIFDPKSVKRIEFDSNYSKIITKSQLSFHQISGQIIQRSKDIFQILETVCENRYILHQSLHRCKKLSKGTLSQARQIVTCLIGFIQINRKCIKCPINCLICQYIHEQKKLYCLIPQKGYYLSKNLIQSCPEDCPFCFNNTLCNYDISQISQNITSQNKRIVSNCILYYGELCLICRTSFFLDVYNNCIHKQKMVDLLNFQLIINLLHPQLNIQQIQNLVLSNKIKQNQLLFQIQIFSANFSILQSDKEDIQGCLQFQYFNSMTRCTKAQENFQYLSSLEDVFYCLNNHCEYNLMLNVTIYISNTQLILLNNRTYFNFLELFNSIKKQLIYIKNVKVKADVYVFELINQECQDYGLFFINYTELQQSFLKTEFKLILNFNNIAVFPQCYQDLIINFDYTEINNLITSSQLNIKIDSDEVKFFKCKFKQENQQLIIMSTQTLFLNTTFINKELQQPLITLQGYEMIKQISFINCNFGDLLLENSNLIDIKSDIQYLLFQSIQITHLYFNFSQFFGTKQSIKNLQIINMNITQSDIRNSYLFVLPKNSSKNSKCLFQLINFDNSVLFASTFIYSELPITVQVLKVRNVNIYQGRFMDLIQNSKISNVLFDEINSQYSIFIQTQNDQAELSSIVVQKSVLEHGTEIIVGISLQIKINSFKILGCDYKYNLNVISILANLISIANIDIVMLNVFGQIYSIIYQYLIFIKGKNIQISNISLNIISLSQQKLLQINYQKLQFDNFSITGIKMKQDSEVLSDLVSFIQQDKHSQSFLSQFKVTEISITWNYQSVLFQFSGKSGPSICSNLSFINMTSNANFYLFSSSTQYILFQNIILINVDSLGFLFQNNSYSDINNFNYYSKSQFSKSREIITPIFSNYASHFEVCKLKLTNSYIGNLMQPLIVLSTNGILELRLFNITIIDYICQDNIISLTQYYISSEINLVQLENIRIRNVSSPKYFIKSIGTQLLINNLCVLNSNIGLLSSVNLDGLIMSNIKVKNSQYQHQHFISIQDQRKNCILNHILFNSLISHNIVKIGIMNENKYKSIMQEFYFQQVNVQNFVIIDSTNLNQIIIRKFKIFQAQFQNFLKLFIKYDRQSKQIDKIYIQDSKIQELFDFMNQQLFVYKLQLINIQFQQSYFNNPTIYEDSYSYNCKYQEQQVQFKNKRLSVLNNYIDQYSPIFLSFHYKKKFQQNLVHSNILQVQFNNNSIVYLPTGIPFNEYIKFNFLTQQQEQIYDYFAIVSNQAEDLSCNLKSSIDEQIGNYTNIDQFILKNQVNIIDNFTFYMNPYQKYTHIQNDIICENFEYVLRFNVRILPCQLGEFFNQNQCKICDVNKLQYSVSKIADFCNIIDINKIEQAKRGQIKLKAGYWRPQIDNNIIEHCKSELCQGGWQVGDQSCLQGQVGALCKECDIYNTRGSGQYAQNEIGCLLCDYSIQLLFKGLLVISWLMFLVYLSYDTNKQVIRQYLSFKISQRKLADILMRQSLNQISVIIKICTNYAFYLYLIKDNLDFLFYEVNVSVNILSNPIQLIGPQIDCLLVKISLIDPVLYFVIVLFLLYAYDVFQINTILIQHYYDNNLQCIFVQSINNIFKSNTIAVLCQNFKHQLDLFQLAIQIQYQ
ncbi:hypothetical protein pb186bvf_014565 [Paramecium bursaria]